MSRDYDLLKEVARGAHRTIGSWKGTLATNGCGKVIEWVSAIIFID
jgi:hypothetical protein